MLRARMSIKMAMRMRVSAQATYIRMYECLRASREGEGEGDGEEEGEREEENEGVLANVGKGVNVYVCWGEIECEDARTTIAP